MMRKISYLLVVILFFASIAVLSRTTHAQKTANEIPSDLSLDLELGQKDPSPLQKQIVAGESKVADLKTTTGEHYTQPPQDVVTQATKHESVNEAAHPDMTTSEQVIEVPVKVDEKSVNNSNQQNNNSNKQENNSGIQQATQGAIENNNLSPSPIPSPDNNLIPNTGIPQPNDNAAPTPDIPSISPTDQPTAAPTTQPTSTDTPVASPTDQPSNSQPTTQESAPSETPPPDQAVQGTSNQRNILQIIIDNILKLFK